MSGWLCLHGCYSLQISREDPHGETPDLRRLVRLGKRVLLAEGVRPCEVGVLLTGDEGIRALNRQYLGHDRPTDVLAFSFQEGPEDGPPFVRWEGGRHYLGDVVISLERAREQAASYGHDWQQEVELLLIHGLLHLLGYDDGEEGARRRMEARQEQLLASFAVRRSLFDSFGDAVAGLGSMLWTQRNARIHLVLAAVAAALGALLGLALWEWAVLVLTIALVLVAEAVNTALEALLDQVSPERSPLARRAKDMAAGAVLLAALSSLAIAVILFLPHLLEWLR